MNKINFTLKKIKSLFLTITLSLLFLTQASAQSISAKNYIEAHKDRAIKMMEKYDIPASIILGVAIHESAYGNSKLARYLNNHFGIKGKNNSTEIKSAYKGYESIEDSYKDFARFLQSRKQFNHLFANKEEHDYRDWALGIARGGYASSKTWSSQVIGIIKKYDLDRFDEHHAKAYLASDQEQTDQVQSYVVKSGDTLSEIAGKYNTSVEQIKRLNRLSSTRLQIGQELSL